MEDDQLEPNFEREAYPPFQPQQIDSAFSKWQLSPEELIVMLEHNLRGEHRTIDNEGLEQWVKSEDTEAMLNEKGIISISNVVIMAGINKFTFLSKMEKGDIFKRLKECMLDIIALLTEKHKDYGIKDPITANILVTKIHYFLESGLLMAMDAGMRDYLKTTTQEIRQYRNTPESEKKKGKHLFGLFGKGED